MNRRELLMGAVASAVAAAMSHLPRSAPALEIFEADDVTWNALTGGYRVLWMPGVGVIDMEQVSQEPGIPIKKGKSLTLELKENGIVEIT